MELEEQLNEGEGHRLMTVCMEVERQAKEKRSPRRATAAENKPFFYIQECKYKCWDVHLPDVLCKNTVTHTAPVHQSHLSFIFRGIEAVLSDTHLHTRVKFSRRWR